jgi:oligopeptide/dipeptide ABC transporter ATP-binding protein
MQLIFQDPYESLNPRQNILKTLSEPLAIHRKTLSETEKNELIQKYLEAVGLHTVENVLERYPHHLSGGQRQRVAIAAAMILEPVFVVADEPVSMLDVSVRAEILKLMLDLQKNKNLTYLFITHDLSLAWLISDRIAILYLGSIMELGRADDIIKRGLHPYTRALTRIMPTPGVNLDKERITLPGEIPSAAEDIVGCKFRARCEKAMSICAEQRPLLEEVGDGHFVACHQCK